MSNLPTQDNAIGANNYCAPFINLTNETLNSYSFEKVNVNYTPILYPNNGQYFQHYVPNIVYMTTPYIYAEHCSDIHLLDKISIEKRMIVIKNFLFYKKNTIEAISQNKFYTLEGVSTVNIGNITLYTEDGFCQLFNCHVSTGFWHTDTNHITHKYFGFDIISLLSYMQAIPYSTAIEQLYSFFESRKFIHRSSDLSEKEFYEQEKNPISYNNPVFFDRFFCKFECIHIVQICNIYNRLIGTAWEVTTKSNEIVDIYFTYWHHVDSVIYNLYPLPPQKPYDLYFKYNNIPYLQVFKSVTICESIHEFCMEPCGDTGIKALLYGGIKNILDTNIAPFAGYTINFQWQNSLSYGFLKLLARKLKENNIQNCFIYKKNVPHNLDDVIKSPEYLGVKRDQCSSSIAEASDQIPGSTRNRVMILDPIIESGTITWLFAGEKVGKTLLALKIAQAIGTGNDTVGTWKALEPKRVLYIDGEMPGDKIKSHIDRIIRGNGKDPEKQGKAFSIYLFAEEGFDYSSILDEEWQKEHMDELISYDLIILDNYYTLYESLNPIKLIRWMKKLASQNGIAFLVLDHTNSDGELQGSMVKRRAMDLGIQLSVLSENDISIDYACDRYGAEYKTKKFTLTKCFASDEIKFTANILKNDANILINFSNSDKRILAIYILKKNGKTNKYIAETLRIAASTVTKDLEKIGLDSDLKQKYSDSQKNSNAQNKIKSKYNDIEKVAGFFLENPNKFEDLLEMIGVAPN